MALTGKKRLFAEALLAGKSNKMAAVVAGYSAASASAAGSRLAKDEDVLAHIQRKTKAAERLALTHGVVPPQDSASDPSEEPTYSNPRDFLFGKMNDPVIEPKLRIEAAKALMPYEFAKKGEGGKKEQKEDAAKKVSSKYPQAASPKLVASGGKSV